MPLYQLAALNQDQVNHQSRIGRVGKLDLEQWCRLANKNRFTIEHYIKEVLEERQGVTFTHFEVFDRPKPPL
jgi:hypothetical protein